MQDIAFPIFKTKIENLHRRFDLNSHEGRKEYFEAKAGKEIRKIRSYLKHGSFIAYLMGKKGSGKGTYAKMFKEAVDPDERVEHFSIGDMIRRFDEVVRSRKKKKEFIAFLKNNFRGFESIDKIIKSMEKRNTSILLPTELILTLVKKEISEKEKKTLFIDGFPRNMDQVSYSLFFRDLIGYRDDPDFFVLIDVPEAVIDERIKYRRVCPKCQTSRNIKLLPTSDVRYDKKNKEFYLWCDNPQCDGAKMVRKEGDEKGIIPIKKRLETDRRVIKETFSLYGIPKILLRNSVPLDKAEEYVDDYELTPEYQYKWNDYKGKVEIIEKPWRIKDDRGVLSYSLLAPPVVVSLIKQLAETLPET